MAWRAPCQGLVLQDHQFWDFTAGVPFPVLWNGFWLINYKNCDPQWRLWTWPYHFRGLMMLTRISKSLFPHGSDLLSLTLPPAYPEKPWEPRRSPTTTSIRPTHQFSPTPPSTSSGLLVSPGNTHARTHTLSLMTNLCLRGVQTVCPLWPSESFIYSSLKPAKYCNWHAPHLHDWTALIVVNLRPEFLPSVSKELLTCINMWRSSKDMRKESDDVPS